MVHNGSPCLVVLLPGQGRRDRCSIAAIAGRGQRFGTGGSRRRSVVHPWATSCGRCRLKRVRDVLGRFIAGWCVAQRGWWLAHGCLMVRDGWMVHDASQSWLMIDGLWRVMLGQYNDGYRSWLLHDLWWVMSVKKDGHWLSQNMVDWWWLMVTNGKRSLISDGELVMVNNDGWVMFKDGWVMVNDSHSWLLMLKKA